LASSSSFFLAASSARAAILAANLSTFLTTGLAAEGDGGLTPPVHGKGEWWVCLLCERGQSGGVVGCESGWMGRVGWCTCGVGGGGGHGGRRGTHGRDGGRQGRGRGRRTGDGHLWHTRRG
jgi:hypothetical protein